jgi:uncharacterized protein (DUF1684 family)/dienelactone hydrolase
MIRNEVYSLCTANFLAIITLLTISCPAIGQESLASDPSMETMQWQIANSQKLKSPNGWLALTGHFWLREGACSVGISETSIIRLPEAAAGVEAEITVKSSTVEFRPVSKHRFVLKDQEVRGYQLLRIDSLAKEADSEDVIQIENRFLLQLVRRSGRLAIRVRDPQSSALVHFPGKTWLPVDPSFRIAAQFHRWPQATETSSTNIRGEAIQLDMVGEVKFQWKGAEHTLMAQQEGDELFIVFKDQSNGNDTYGPGRFVNVPMPSVEPGENVAIVLDFNRSYNPPCAFSTHTLCPLAPANNRLPFLVRAGESYLPREKRLAKIERVMGSVPSDERRVLLSIQELTREKLEGYDRVKISFAAEQNDRVPAWLLIPHGASKSPAMLCLHQTIHIGKDEPIGLGQQESKRQALHLVKRGYVCLAPDYPSFGEYPFDFDAAFAKGDYASGSMKAIWNNMRAIDLLCSLPEVDSERIGAIGHSLGGHNALFTAAFDPRVKVVVSSCGFCSFHRYYGGNLKGWTSSRYMPRIASEYENDPKKMPFDFDDVLLSIFPRAVFVMAPQKDSNFDVTGVQQIVNTVEPMYKNAKYSDRFSAVYPDAGHEWPELERTAAYEFIDKQLK